jgi:putative transposase
MGAIVCEYKLASQWILKEQRIPPSRERAMTWRTFLRAHWHALFAADFFTTEIWTVRGLVTYYRAFVIELHSRRVQVLGSTPNPDEAFVVQTMRHLTDDVDGMLRGDRLLICDRDRKWSAAVERFLATAGVRVIRTPLRAPNCNAYADRFVRSIREECLNRVIPLGERASSSVARRVRGALPRRTEPPGPRQRAG